MKPLKLENNNYGKSFKNLFKMSSGRKLLYWLQKKSEIWPLLTRGGQVMALKFSFIFFKPVYMFQNPDFFFLFTQPESSLALRQIRFKTS